MRLRGLSARVEHQQCHIVRFYATASQQNYSALGMHHDPYLQRSYLQPTVTYIGALLLAILPTVAHVGCTCGH